MLPWHIIDYEMIWAIATFWIPLLIEMMIKFRGCANAALVQLKRNCACIFLIFNNAMLSKQQRLRIQEVLAEDCLEIQHVLGNAKST